MQHMAGLTSSGDEGKQAGRHLIQHHFGIHQRDLVSQASRKSLGLDP